MKVSFFFRTRDEFERMAEKVKELNENLSERTGWRDNAWVSLNTKYTSNNEMYNNIPKRKKTKKKYLAFLHSNEEKMKRLGVNLENFIINTGLELVDNSAGNEPKYTGETTTKRTKLQSHDEFRVLVSALNNAFGNGNWRLDGPKKTLTSPGMQAILKRLQAYKENTNTPFMSMFAEKYQNGVPVRIIVNKPDVDLNKYLFKVRLKV